MSLHAAQPAPSKLAARIQHARAITAEFMAEIIGTVFRRAPPSGQYVGAARLNRLIETGAWTDVALALLDLELPQWRLRRLGYDHGQWYCTLSRQRELPDWLDEPVETRHVDMTLAILAAIIEARRVTAPPSRTSVPPVGGRTTTAFEPMLADNFG